MINKPLTGKELAEAHLWHLTPDEVDEYFRKNKKKARVHSSEPFAKLMRRIFKPHKIYLIRFKGGNGVIIRGDNKRDACIRSVPFIAEGMHHCREPLYSSSCEECRAALDELAEKLNNSTVTWLGWAQPDYNWVLHI